MSTSVLKPGEIQHAAALIEVAALYLLDGAFNTALERLKEAMPIVEAAAEERNVLLARLTQEAAA